MDMHARPQPTPRKAGAAIEARGRTWRLVVDQDPDSAGALWCVTVDDPDREAWILPEEVTPNPETSR